MFMAHVRSRRMRFVPLLLVCWVLMITICYMFYFTQFDTNHEMDYTDYSTTKPLLFIHFHKAGGTTVMQTFSDSDEYNFYPIGYNGNLHTFLHYKYRITDHNEFGERINYDKLCSHYISNITKLELYNIEYYTLSFRITLYFYNLIGQKWKWFDSLFFNSFDQCFYNIRHPISWTKLYTNPKKFEKFLNYLKFHKYNVIATEFTFYSKSAIYFNRIKPYEYFNIFTMIRDPLKRFLSKYYFENIELHGKYSKLFEQRNIDLFLFYLLNHPNENFRKENLLKYLENKNKKTQNISNILNNPVELEKYSIKYINETKDLMLSEIGTNDIFAAYPNYYVRYLNGFRKDSIIYKQHLETGKKILGTFDCIAILDLSQTWILFEKKYNIKIKPNDQSKKEKYHLNQRKYTKYSGKIKANKQFEQMYINDNMWDYQLYNFAVNLSLTQLKQYETEVT